MVIIFFKFNYDNKLWPSVFMPFVIKGVTLTLVNERWGILL